VVPASARTINAKSTGHRAMIASPSNVDGDNSTLLHLWRQERPSATRLSIDHQIYVLQPVPAMDRIAMLNDRL
jgi:hypothetical protein